MNIFENYLKLNNKIEKLIELADAELAIATLKKYLFAPELVYYNYERILQKKIRILDDRTLSCDY